MFPARVRETTPEAGSMIDISAPQTLTAAWRIEPLFTLVKDNR
jgi:hypothetical protein